MRVYGLAVVIVCFPEYDENNEHMSQLLTIFLTFKARVSSKALHANLAMACDSWSAIKRIHTCIHYARRSCSNCLIMYTIIVTLSMHANISTNILCTNCCHDLQLS